MSTSALLRLLNSTRSVRRTCPVWRAYRAKPDASPSEITLPSFKKQLQTWSLYSSCKLRIGKVAHASAETRRQLCRSAIEDNVYSLLKLEHVVTPYVRLSSFAPSLSVLACLSSSLRRGILQLAKGWDTEAWRARILAETSTARSSSSKDLWREIRPPYQYYVREREQNMFFCRALLGEQARGASAASEELLLDLSETATVESEGLTSIACLKVAKDQCHIAYTIDTTGEELYTLCVRRLGDGHTYQHVHGVGPGIEWGSCGRLYYTTLDERGRPNAVKSHVVGSPAASDIRVLSEPDDRFSLVLGRTKALQQRVARILPAFERVLRAVFYPQLAAWPFLRLGCCEPESSAGLLGMSGLVLYHCDLHLRCFDAGLASKYPSSPAGSALGMCSTSGHQLHCEFSTPPVALPLRVQGALTVS
ncbi:hypothetical protein CYMTET_32497 [Cymbomonas tetramitiformis]|uniref:Peptidase S9A N-terminal domain-containing protein n=1 Tax=Cymbomonas tetramitiformis TaxID=36881 RepID=A0AAE0FEX3_9CHLO|nr:hypothetical protein CYMTET_32497 [Cymbomonas tetramitiformis]